MKVSYPIDAAEFVLAGDLETVANLLSVLAHHFASRPDLTDAERGSARTAHAAISSATGEVWRRAYEAKRRAYEARTTRDAAE